MDFSIPSFPQLETARLLLRQETPEDAEAVLAVFSDPAVTQFHDLDTFTTLKEAVGVIERRAKAICRWARNPVGNRPEARLSCDWLLRFSVGQTSAWC